MRGQKTLNTTANGLMMDREGVTVVISVRTVVSSVYEAEGSGE